MTSAVCLWYLILIHRVVVRQQWAIESHNLMSERFTINLAASRRFVLTLQDWHQANIKTIPLLSGK